MPEYLLAATGLNFAYGERRVLSDAGFALAPDEKVALTGANGSGKTTLFRCLTGLAPLESGQITLSGRSIKTEADFRFLRQKVGYSLQNADDQLIFPTVLEDVCFGPLNLGLSEAEAQARACAILARLGLEGNETRLTHQLSGGQQKLAALATVLVMEPEVLLLDEPFNALDSRACDNLCAILADYKGAMLVVAHEIDYLSRFCKRRLTLGSGRLVSADMQAMQ